MKSKKEMLDALLAGETLVNKNDDSFCRMELDHELGPFVFYADKESIGERMKVVWEVYETTGLCGTIKMNGKALPVSLIRKAI